MKKLEAISKFAKVRGNVIEHHGDHTYALRRYYTNEYGEYDVKDIKELTLKEYRDVESQESLATRVKRLHHYFRGADYISDNTISLLNWDNEDPFEVLSDIVD